jgi:hypothetical protein
MLPTFSIHRAWIIQFTFFVAIALLAGACSTSDRSPTQYVEDPAGVSELADGADMDIALGSDHHPRGFYPLTKGNRWTYRGAMMMRIEGDSITAVGQYAERRELTGLEDLCGREYMVETQKRWSTIVPFPPLDLVTNKVWYRQDKAGLYEADCGTSTTQGSGDHSPALVNLADRFDPVGWEAKQSRFSASLAASGRDGYQAALRHLVDKIRAAEAAVRTTGMHRRPRHMGGPPGGVLSDEITRLKYPLHPRQHWVIRESPRFESYVEQFRVFNLPAGRMGGYAIRVDSEFFDKNDRVEIWYGRNGFLGMRTHLEAVATDEFGDPIGTLISDERMWLEHLELVRKSP